MYKTWLRSSRNIYKRYSGGWVIITGASDGIGKEYAFQLAAKGFNICLIGRNYEKLEDVSNTIRK